MNDYDATNRSIKVGVFVLIILTGLYMLMIFFNLTEKQPEPEGIIVRMILFFKLDFSNISPIL
jgi:hypothetical protein